MREIKCRGKTEDGRWVHGYLYVNKKNVPMIISNGAGGGFVLVLPETIGEFTGRKDKTGKEIYEKDIAILKFHTALYECKWNEEYARFIWQCLVTNECRVLKEESEVIGNIFDNPDLVK